MNYPVLKMPDFLSNFVVTHFTFFAVMLVSGLRHYNVRGRLSCFRDLKDATYIYSLLTSCRQTMHGHVKNSSLGTSVFVLPHDIVS